MMCEQTLNIKYQAWSDVFKHSAGEYDIFLSFHVLLIAGHPCHKGVCLNSVLQKALTTGSIAGQHTQNVTEKVITYSTRNIL